jgi:CheY-like chemotaxis protein
LERLGYRADVAANGLEALDALHRQPYDVVLMDMQMPEMDGLEATRQIWQIWQPAQRPRIIAMTANAMQSDRELCLDTGMDDYVSKPVRLEDLIAALERCAPGQSTVATSAASTPTEPAVDCEVLARLQADLGGGDPGIVIELIDLFLLDTPLLLTQMRQALSSGDVLTARRAAHTLKSSSASLGLGPLASHCHEFEMLAQSGQLTDGISMLERIGNIYAQAARELEEQREHFQPLLS